MGSKEIIMAHDIEQWEDGIEGELTVPRPRPPAPILTAKDRKTSNKVFDKYASSIAEMAAEGIHENFNSPDPRKRIEAKEMLVKLSPYFFQKKAAELPSQVLSGDMEDDAVDGLTKLIQDKREAFKIESPKGLVDENNDGATFCT